MESIPRQNTPVLVVDDDVGLLLSMKAALISAGMPEPALISDSRRVMDFVRNNSFHLILLDLVMPNLGGMDLLKEIKEEFPSIECIIVTAVDDVASAVQAMKYGAYDYLVKPIDSEKLIIVVNRALERHNLKNKLALFERNPRFKDLKHPEAFSHMIAADPSMAMVFHQVEVAAPTDYNIVITGESGTGKEMIARIIHSLSNRSDGPFVAVNMASFSKTLFEDDFFGHEKGAYTGAVSDKKGFFEAARGGTLFLDEITELDPSLQGKMLRVIQERELYRLGSTKVRNVDIRIISATNKDILDEIQNERFREDLFYRLNMFHIKIPPLREREDDLRPLAEHFMKIHANKNSKTILSIEPELIHCLMAHPLPGNVRELENIIAKAVLMETSSTLTPAAVSDLLSSYTPPLRRAEDIMTLAELEKIHIRHALEKTHGNRTQAAKILGIGLRTLQRKLKEWQEFSDMPD
ncbi:MAG: sigma-54-dependent Fis family transcriptional regulator [Deltaproteobacteria bacterium]|nr:sigma-54-dependent Fis family transcriptional regulator [Deltaproteobacteria bacterium]